MPRGPHRGGQGRVGKRSVGNGDCGFLTKMVGSSWVGTSPTGYDRSGVSGQEGRDFAHPQGHAWGRM